MGGLRQAAPSPGLSGMAEGIVTLRATGGRRRGAAQRLEESLAQVLRQLRAG